MNVLRVDSKILGIKANLYLLLIWKEKDIILLLWIHLAVIFTWFWQTRKRQTWEKTIISQGVRKWMRMGGGRGWGASPSWSAKTRGRPTISCFFWPCFECPPLFHCSLSSIQTKHLQLWWYQHLVYNSSRLDRSKAYLLPSLSSSHFLREGSSFPPPPSLSLLWFVSLSLQVKKIFSFP